MEEGKEVKSGNIYHIKQEMFFFVCFFLYFSDTVIVYLSVLCVVSSLFSTNCICQGLNVLFVLESSLMYSYSCFYFAHRQYIQFICSLVSGKAICCQSCDFSSHLRVRHSDSMSDIQTSFTYMSLNDMHRTLSEQSWSLISKPSS